MSTDTMSALGSYLQEFQQRYTGGGDQAPGWLQDLRSEAMLRFGELGFPGRNREDWKYNLPVELTSNFFQPVSPADSTGQSTSHEGIQATIATAGEISDLDAHEIVLDPIMGLILPEGEIPGVEILPATTAGLADDELGSLADWREQPFTALNTGFMSEPLVIRIAPGTELDRPLHLIIGGGPNGTMTSPRLLILAGAGSYGTILESHIGLPGVRAFSNMVTELRLDQDARLNHYKLIQPAGSAFHIGNCSVAQGAGSRYNSVEVILGGAMSRREIHLDLGGSGAVCDLRSLYLTHGEQRADTRTRVRHLVPGCETFELYKGILDGSSRGVFDGHILIERDAQESLALQTNRNLLLSDDAVVNSMPQLEIYADDVKCSHGSTTGQLEDEQIFYLRSRGFSTETARALLTWAFAREIVEAIKIEPVRRMLGGKLLDLLPQGELIRETL
jgi:Fe-S cluster assembly protein SufD